MTREIEASALTDAVDDIGAPEATVAKALLVAAPYYSRILEVQRLHQAALREIFDELEKETR